MRAYLPGPPPRPTLADAGSRERRSRPFRSTAERSLGLDADGWQRFGTGLARVVGHCRDRGYEPTFHPETGTYVEAPWEIEQVLDRSDIGLCLETGHMMLGGGDPVALLRDWAERVNHVHLKDASLAVRDQIVADGAQATEIWSREAFPVLGGGDLDVDAVLDGLRGMSFGGWLVVEQDILPRSAERFARAAEEQRLNRAFLAARGRDWRPGGGGRERGRHSGWDSSARAGWAAPTCAGWPARSGWRSPRSPRCPRPPAAPCPTWARRCTRASRRCSTPKPSTGC